MNFLYIVLGLAMMSGISAMMKIGNNVNNLMLLSTFKENDYFKSSLPSYDRRIMAILDKYSGPANNVCSHIKGELANDLYEDGEIYFATGTQTPSLHSLFMGSCVLVNKDLNHRVIVNKNSLGTFNLFSCFLKDETFCPYEENK